MFRYGIISSADSKKYKRRIYPNDKKGTTTFFFAEI